MPVKPEKFEELLRISKVVCAITNLLQFCKNISAIGKFHDLYGDAFLFNRQKMFKLLFAIFTFFITPN